MTAPEPERQRDGRAAMFAVALEARDRDIEFLSLQLEDRTALLRRCAVSMRACPAGAHRPVLAELADVVGGPRPRVALWRRILGGLRR